MLQDVVATFAVCIVAAALFAGVTRRTDAAERRLMLAAFVAHVGGVFVQVWVIEVVYGGGDIDGYFRSGVELANALRLDFEQIFPETIKLFFHDDDAQLPFLVFGGWGPTASLTVIAAYLFYLLADSLLAASMCVALGAYFGKLALFAAIGKGQSAETRRSMLIGVLLVPSVVFWSSSLAKEAVVIGFFGLALLLLRNIVAGDLQPFRLVLALVCLIPVAMIKPYVLLPLSLSFGAWFYWDRASRLGQSVTVRPAYAVLAVITTTVFFLVVGQISPQFAVENIARSTATSQIAGRTVEGGSNYQLREAVEETAEVSVQSQLLLAPIALPTALFRPFIFEVRNPMMFLNALETTALLFLFARVLARGGLVRVRAAVMSNPLLIFFFVFTVVMGTAVGLASTNLGSLSRYRMPLMPFFVTMILMLDRQFQPKPLGRLLPRFPLSGKGE